MRKLLRKLLFWLFNRQKTKVKLRIYKDLEGNWRWRLRTMGNDVIAISGEGYKCKADCIAMAAIILNGVFLEEFELV